MKKDTQPSLQKLWALKREAGTSAEPDADDFPPALATRIAARWAADGETPGTSMLWERMMTVGLALALVICGTTAWLRPDPAPDQSQDVMVSLFTARPAPDDDFPF